MILAKSQHPAHCATLFLALLLVFASILVPFARGQESRVITNSAAPAAGAKPVAGQPGNRQGPRAQPAAKGSPPKGKDSKTQKPNEKPGEESPQSVQRGDTPKFTTEQELFGVVPDAEGKVRFRFRGVSWPPLIEWLGHVSKLSVDWRELPGDYVNLTTQRAYTLEETRDIISRHLLDRGYVMLRNGEFLTVVKASNINPAIVPRVSSGELNLLSDHDYVKTSFELDWLVAKDVVIELESMKSKNGRLTALAGSNRIEAMDTVQNLRQIAAILRQEQSADSQADLVRQFTLKHVRAASVRTQLLEILGIQSKTAAPSNSSSRGGGNSFAMQQAMMNMQRQMQQMAQRPKQGNKSGPARSPEPKISILVNDAQNSLIVNAPPDKMVIIERTIELLDVPNPRGRGLESMVAGFQTYHLATLDPNKVLEVLTLNGGLDPKTRIQVDADHQALIVSGPPWDHMIVRQLIEKLDGSARDFRVVRLRRRRADQVATTIEQLIVGPKEDDESNNRSRYRYYGYYGNNNNDSKKDKDKFRVGADVENNWILLWCNELEYKQVLSFLEQLGEVPIEGQTSGTVRVIESIPSDQQEVFLRRLKAAFEELAPNPVELPDSVDDPPESDQENERKDVQDSNRKPEEANETRLQDNSVVLPSNRHLTKKKVALFQDDLLAMSDTPEAESRPRPEGTKSPVREPQLPAVKIERGPNGAIIIRSMDPRALSLIEDLVDRMRPTSRDFEMFRLKHASATWVALTLEEFFEEEKDDSNQMSRYRYFYWEMPSSSEKKPASLSDQPKLRFISDFETNTIVVRGASPSQLGVVRELIDLYDVPEPANSESLRHVKMFAIKYSDAEVVSETIKDAFRDLLSGNDKTFQQQQQRNGKQQQQSSRRDSGGSDFSDSQGNATGGPRTNFKGKLSIGVNKATNTLIVSTDGEKLMGIIETMIDELDQAAVPLDAVRVVQLDQSLGASTVQATLRKLFGAPGAAQPANDPSSQQKQQREADQPRRERSGRNPARPVASGTFND